MGLINQPTYTRNYAMKIYVLYFYDADIWGARIAREFYKDEQKAEERAKELNNELCEKYKIPEGANGRRDYYAYYEVDEEELIL